MIISHDRQTLFIGVPKNGSQTARAVLGQIGVDLVGEMGRHPTVPEAIRLAEVRFPGETIAPAAIYAFWRDPVERFCSAVEFHKRCLPNSFVQLFPERFVGIELHPRLFEIDPEAIELDMRAVIDSIPPIDILAALPPPAVPGGPFHSRKGNLSFYRRQSEWLEYPGIALLPFADYEQCIREVVSQLGGAEQQLVLPHLNATQAGPSQLTPGECAMVQAFYEPDMAFGSRVNAL